MLAQETGLEPIKGEVMATPLGPFHPVRTAFQDFVSPSVKVTASLNPSSLSCFCRIRLAENCAHGTDASRMATFPPGAWLGQRTIRTSATPSAGLGTAYAAVRDGPASTSQSAWPNVHTH